MPGHKLREAYRALKALLKVSDYVQTNRAERALKVALTTSINSVYQNRDHCGDTICKTPKKAIEYRELKKKDNK